MGTGKFWISFLLVVVGRFCEAAGEGGADSQSRPTTVLGRQVLIVYNDQEPEGQALAAHYAVQRDVPTSQICRISVRPAETITRKEFAEQVRRPIARFLTEQGLWKQLVRSGLGLSLSAVAGVETVENQIAYVVLVYGVPLRIERDPGLKEETKRDVPAPMRRNEAAVDSELAVLPSPGLPVTGPVGNPFYNAESWRFESPLNRQMLLVGRLDGPDAQTVRRMIKDAVAVERAGGLRGRAYFDVRSIKEAGYVEGDNWLRRAHEAFQQAGVECVLDEKPETWPQEFPMEDAAIYAGWYMPNVVGPFTRKEFRFKPGAIAYHLHSNSGSGVRTRVAYWVGPLLDKGAAATMGNVYEPYLMMTPHVDRFFLALLGGATFLEAAYWSQPALSWQTTFVGDPLYRPFAQRSSVER